jgi:hypothetical protein
MNNVLEDFLKVKDEIDRLSKITIEGKEFDIRQIQIVVHPDNKHNLSRYTNIPIIVSEYAPKDELVIIEKQKSISRIFNIDKGQL